MYSPYIIHFRYINSLRSKNKHTSKRPLKAQATTAIKKKYVVRRRNQRQSLGPKEKRKIAWNRIGDKRGRKK